MNCFYHFFIFLLDFVDDLRLILCLYTCRLCEYPFQSWWLFIWCSQAARIRVDGVWVAVNHIWLNVFATLMRSTLHSIVQRSCYDGFDHMCLRMFHFVWLDLRIFTCCCLVVSHLITSITSFKPNAFRCISFNWTTAWKNSFLFIRLLLLPFCCPFPLHCRWLPELNMVSFLYCSHPI